MGVDRHKQDPHSRIRMGQRAPRQEYHTPGAGARMLSKLHAGQSARQGQGRRRTRCKCGSIYSPGPSSLVLPRRFGFFWGRLPSTRIGSSSFGGTGDRGSPTPNLRLRGVGFVAGAFPEGPRRRRAVWMRRKLARVWPRLQRPVLLFSWPERPTDGQAQVAASEPSPGQRPEPVRVWPRRPPLGPAGAVGGVATRVATAGAGRAIDTAGAGDGFGRSLTGRGQDAGPSWRRRGRGLRRMRVYRAGMIPSGLNGCSGPYSKQEP